MMLPACVLTALLCLVQAYNDSDINASEICSLPKHRGPCDTYELRYYFNTERDECAYFFYGGCEGNDNNFATVKECEEKCTMKRTSTAPPTTTPIPRLRITFADVRALVAKFHEVNETENVLDGFDRIGEHSKELYRLGGPVRELLRVRLNSANTSQDYHDCRIVMLELHSLFDKHIPHNYRSSQSIYATGNWIFRAMAALTHSWEIIEDAHIVDKMREVLYDVFIDPRFLLGGSGYYNVHESLLSMIDNSDIGKCQMFTNEGMSKFDESFELSERESCGPGKIFEYDSDALLHELRRIRSDLLRLILVNSIIGTKRPNTLIGTDIPCIYKRYPHLPKEYNITETSIGAVERAGEEISEWARNIQDAMWGKIGIQSAKKLLRFGNITKEYFNITAQKIQETLEMSGSKIYSYHVLIGSTRRVDLFSVLTENVDDYAFVINYKKIDVHIFRYAKRAERAAYAKKWMKEKKDVILKGISARESNASNSTTANSILSSIHDDPSIGPVVGENMFKSIILLRSYQVEGSFGVRFMKHIPVGLASSDAGCIRDHRASLYEWKAFFFL